MLLYTPYQYIRVYSKLEYVSTLATYRMIAPSEVLLGLGLQLVCGRGARRALEAHTYALEFVQGVVACVRVRVYMQRHI